MILSGPLPRRIRMGVL